MRRETSPRGGAGNRSIRGARPGRVRTGPDPFPGRRRLLVRPGSGRPDGAAGRTISATLVRPGPGECRVRIRRRRGNRRPARPMRRRQRGPVGEGPAADRGIMVEPPDPCARRTGRRTRRIPMPRPCGYTGAQGLSRGGTSPNSPRVGRQQGSVSSAGCAGGPFSSSRTAEAPSITDGPSWWITGRPARPNGASSRRPGRRPPLPAGRRVERGGRPTNGPIPPSGCPPGPLPGKRDDSRSARLDADAWVRENVDPAQPGPRPVGLRRASGRWPCRARAPRP